MKPVIRIAHHAGMCYGVERALKLTRQALCDAKGPVRTLGPLIHNPLVVCELERDGVASVSSVQDVSSGTVVVRAHGVVPETIQQAQDAGLELVDATCPHVKRVHLAAARLVSEGYQLIVVGEAGHPEVEGIVGHAGGNAHVVSRAEELEGLALTKRIGVVVQTTQTLQNLEEICTALLSYASEVRVINTICNATSERQLAAYKLASHVEVMVVVGGKNSGNTRRLAEICQDAGARTYLIEDACELDRAWFEGVTQIGITAGASTPSEHIDRAIRELIALTGGSCEQ